MTMSPDGAVADTLQPMLGEKLEKFVAISRVENLDRDEFLPGALMRQVRHQGALLCGSTPYFDHNTMLPNGDVVLCCMDYAREHVLGNLLRQSYAELFTGSEMAAIRARAMCIDDAGLICRRCHNAVDLDQGEGTHWQLRREAMWARPHQAMAEAPPPPTPPLTSPALPGPSLRTAGPPSLSHPRPGFRDLVRRLRVL